MTEPLTIFVEGPDDEDLVKNIITSCYKQDVIVIKYSQLPLKLFKETIKDLKQNNAPYVILTDLDKTDCLVEKKKSKSQTFFTDPSNIIIAEKEIESWYAAGAPPSIFNKKGQKCITITKEDFDKLAYPKIHSQILEEILNTFETKRAKRNSKSFSHFYNKIGKIFKQRGILTGK